MKISVIGAGGWGTTLSILLHYNGHNVTLWEYDKKYVKQIIKHRENKVYLPDIPIPEEILVTNDLLEATYDKNMIVLAVPTQFLRSVVKNIKPTILKTQFLLRYQKG
jgi:glycerol-3-phosphate dehydrogenase (NAD(P)+)